MYLEYRSIADLDRAIITGLGKFQKRFDLIVGIPRSGMLPANLVALYLNRPFTDLDSFLRGQMYSSGRRFSFDYADIRRVLVMDDSIMSGKALSMAQEKIITAGVDKKYDIEYGVVYATTKSAPLVDIYCETIDYPRIFQWNLFHHNYYIPLSCFDIDGVLCENPTIDDDGPLYLEHLTGARPLYIPDAEIDMLVTCRLEKYRKPTEDWLARNGVRYKRLVMLDLPNKEVRIAWGKHGTYKGEVYKKSGNVLFVESSLHEAKDIARVSGKPVFCTENFTMMNPNESFERAKHRAKRSRLFLHQLFKRR